MSSLLVLCVQINRAILVQTETCVLPIDRLAAQTTVCGTMQIWTDLCRLAIAVRDGGAIVGATSAAYLVQSADVGHSLACEVAATNVAVHASAKSNPLAVTLPAVTVSSAKLVVSAGSARVPIACASAVCAGMIELTGQIAVEGKGKKQAKKTVVLGRGSYSLAAGKSALAKAKGHKLFGKAGVTVTGG